MARGSSCILHTALREATRERLGRSAQPHAAIIDSQSVKTTAIGGPRGYDGAQKLTGRSSSRGAEAHGAQKLTGRKRHLRVDTQGLVLQARVHPADLQDRAAVPLVLEGVARLFPRIALLWADQGDTGGGKAWVEAQRGWRVTIVQHPPQPRGRWVPPGDLSDLATVWCT